MANIMHSTNTLSGKRSNILLFYICLKGGYIDEWLDKWGVITDISFFGNELWIDLDSRWAYNSEPILKMFKELDLNCMVTMFEPGMCIYGKMIIEKGEVQREEYLSEEDWDKYTYNEEKGLYYLYGEEYLDEEEVLEVIWEEVFPSWGY